MMNGNNSAVKRIMRESQEVMQEASSDFTAAPLEDNIFEWHFTIRGAHETEFEGGIYHGRIILPPDYPFKPPNIVLLTPNGRFEVGVKICLSISAHHPETWQPSWSIRTVLVALISFMSTEGKGAVGALDYTPQERKTMASKSIHWSCSKCGVHNNSALPEPKKDTATSTTSTTTTTSTVTSSSSSSDDQQQKQASEQEKEQLNEEKKETEQLPTDNNNNNNKVEQVTQELSINDKEKEKEPAQEKEKVKEEEKEKEKEKPTVVNRNVKQPTPTQIAQVVNNNNNHNNNNNRVTPTINVNVNNTRRIESITRPSTTNIDRLIVIVFILLMAFLFKKLFY